MDDLTKELAAALGNLLHQAEQMRGMFPDEDHTISEAVDDAKAALRRYYAGAKISSSSSN